MGVKFSPFLHLAVREISKSSKREGSNWMFSPFSDIEIVLTTILIFEGELNRHESFSEVQGKKYTKLAEILIFWLWEVIIEVE